MLLSRYLYSVYIGGFSENTQLMTRFPHVRGCRDITMTAVAKNTIMFLTYNFHSWVATLNELLKFYLTIWLTLITSSLTTSLCALVKFKQIKNIYISRNILQNQTNFFFQEVLNSLFAKHNVSLHQCEK